MESGGQMEPQGTDKTSRRTDLAGQRFGRLTALRPAGNIGGRTVWLCRCDCGREVAVKTARLRDGRAKTCGSPDCRADGGIGRRLTYVDGTCVEMLRAKTVRRNNTSGVPGVEWVASRQRWRATICFQGRRRYLGRFVRFEDAVKARKDAEARLHDAFLERYFLQNSGEE